MDCSGVRGVRGIRVSGDKGRDFICDRTQTVCGEETKKKYYNDRYLYKDLLCNNQIRRSLKYIFLSVMSITRH